MVRRSSFLFASAALGSQNRSRTVQFEGLELDNGDSCSKIPLREVLCRLVFCRQRPRSLINA